MNDPKPIRPGTKLATLISMLEAGTTLTQITDATGWQKHTARGTLSNLKKRHNLTIISEKSDSNERVYRIIENPSNISQE